MKLTLYHNPRCSNSRGALKILQELDADVTIIEYLKSPPTAAEVAALAKNIEGPASQLIRAKESAYQEAALSVDSSTQELADAIAARPILLQRPIVVHGEKALIARPPEKLRDWLKSLD